MNISTKQNKYKTWFVRKYVTTQVQYTTKTQVQDSSTGNISTNTTKTQVRNKFNISTLQMSLTQVRNIV